MKEIIEHIKECIWSSRVIGYLFSIINRLRHKFCKHKWKFNNTIPAFDIGDDFTPDNPTKFDDIYFCEKCKSIKRVRFTR